MFFRFFLFSVLLVLASCAYFQEKQIQDIRIETPGAENALCYVYVEKLKYEVSPPDTIMISKSKEDLAIDCLAPGNRRKKVFIRPTLSKSVMGDVATGIVPGLLWDYGSDSMYKYPDLVTVDFTNTPTKPEALPAQNRPDVVQPEEYPLEEFLPGRPRMNSDRFEQPVQFQKRNDSDASTDETPYMVDTDTTVKSGDKGDLKKAAPSAALNPAGDPSTPAKAGPAYPGQ